MQHAYLIPRNSHDGFQRSRTMVELRTHLHEGVIEVNSRQKHQMIHPSEQMAFP